MFSQTRRTGLLLVITGAILWGINGTVSKKLFQSYEIDVNWLVSTRLLIAGILLLGVQFISKDRSQIWGVWNNKKTAIHLVIFGLLGMLAVQYTYMASIHHGNAAVATLLQYLAPVMIIIYLIMRKQMVCTRQDVLTVSLAVIGCFFLLTNGLSLNCPFLPLRSFGAYYQEFVSLLYLICRSPLKTIRFSCYCWLGYDDRRTCIKFDPSALANQLCRIVDSSLFISGIRYYIWDHGCILVLYRKSTKSLSERNKSFQQFGAASGCFYNRNLVR